MAKDSDLKFNEEKSDSQLIFEPFFQFRQNYFTFDNTYFLLNDGLAMGSRLSVVSADIYLRYID